MPYGSIRGPERQVRWLVAGRMMLAVISLETHDILSCGIYRSPKGRLVMVDLGQARQLYMPNRLDKFTHSSIICSYEYRTNVAVMKQFCLMAAK